jgi:hypothetical protein
MSAQVRHTGPESSMINHPPSPLPQTEHLQSLIGETTTRSGGRLRRSVRRARFRSDSSWETQCVRYARSISGSPDFENRSGRRSRVRATYAVSLGSSPRTFAQRRQHCIAVEIFPRLVITTRSR